MENIIDFILEFAPIFLSVLATFKAFLTGKNRLTAEEIEHKAELKKQKYLNKLNKKNKVNPNTIKSVPQAWETDLQTIEEISKNI